MAGNSAAPVKFSRLKYFPAHTKETAERFVSLFHRYAYIYRPFGGGAWISANEQWSLTDTEILKANEQWSLTDTEILKANEQWSLTDTEILKANEQWSLTDTEILKANEQWSLTDTEILKAIACVHPKAFIGTRSGKASKYAVLDIDAGSCYHSKEGLQKITSLLEKAGISEHNLYRSSESGGWHLYIFFDAPVSSDILISEKKIKACKPLTAVLLS